MQKLYSLELLGITFRSSFKNRENQRGHMEGRQTHRKMFLSLLLREMQIQTTVSYHLTPVRMAIVNKPANQCC